MHIQYITNAATKPITMKNLGKSVVPKADNRRKIRHKRLEIKRLRSVDRKRKPMAQNDQRLSTTSSSDCSKGDDNSDVESGGLVFGHVSMMGRRRVMEDTVTVAPPVLAAEKYYFFGVYDGHGGPKVAENCQEKMHKFVAKHVKEEKEKKSVEESAKEEKGKGLAEESAEESAEEGGFDWKKVMDESFRSMEAEIEQECRNMPTMIGSTATVVLVGKDELVVANCGDSRAVLSRDGIVVPLSTDHKPERPDEKERIEAAGGMVINWNGWRVEGVLSTSRALGDGYLKPYVCSEPEVSVFKRTVSDEVLIIGTDGLFDVVCNEVACDVVNRCLSGQLKRKEAEESRVSEAAALLAELAIARGSKDNISVIIVQMK